MQLKKARLLRSRMRKRETAFWLVADVVVGVSTGLFITGYFTVACVQHHVAKRKALTK